METENLLPIPPPDPDSEPLEALDALTHSFVVVIRPTSLDDKGKVATWRGSVEHVQSRERIYFLGLARLNAFIAERCGFLVDSTLGKLRLARVMHTARARDLQKRFVRYLRSKNPFSESAAR